MSRLGLKQEEKIRILLCATVSACRDDELIAPGQANYTVQPAHLHPSVVQFYVLTLVDVFQMLSYFLALVQSHSLQKVPARSANGVAARPRQAPRLTFWMRRAIRLSRYRTSRSRTKFFLL